MAAGIYKITDKRNNKIYIGRAVNLDNRKWRHFCYIHPENYSFSSLQSEINMDIHKAMMESGNENDFIFEIIEECNVDLLDEKEQYYISLFHSTFPNGYNKTKGGNTYPHCKGEEHPNHKITNEEAQLIKNLLKQGKSVQDIQSYVPIATMGIISSINNGYTWRDEKIIYPISKLNGVKKFSNEQILEIRKKRSEGMSTVILAQEYNTTTSNISAIATGTTHKDINDFIIQKETRNIFTQKEVEFFREQYYIHNISIKQLYETSIFKNKISYFGFRDMVNGTTYSQYKTYDKTLKINNLKDRNNLIRKLALQGLTKKEIAKYCNCSERTVYRAINKEGKFE